MFRCWVLFWALFALQVALPAGADAIVYFGTRADGPEQGITAARFDATTGHLTSIGTVAQVKRPTWLIAHPTLPVLYSVSEVGNDGLTEAGIYSFAADAATGQLQLLNTVGSGGGGATHLAIDAVSRSLFAANYGTGQVSWLPILPDGRLGLAMSVQSDYGTGPHRRQKSPHAHGVAIDPTHRSVLVADLGADRLFVYGFDPATRQLTPASTPYVSVAAGSGPRHLAFHPKGRFVYLVTELTAEVIAYEWDAKRARLRQVQALPIDEPDFKAEKSASHLEFSRDGRYLYVSDRGASSLIVYLVDERTGKLREVQRIASQGQVPWSFSLEPGGRWLLVANHGSNSIAVFAVDPETGKLTATQESLSVTQPSNVTFLAGH